MKRAVDGMTASRLLTVQALAERWDCTVATVLSMVRDRGVPYLQIGRRKPLDARGPKDLRFRPDAIDRWEREQEVVWGQTDPATAATASAGQEAILRSMGRVDLPPL